MHYNLNEQLKPKRNIPYKKILVVCVIILLLVAAYALFVHGGGPAQAPEVNKPT